MTRILSMTFFKTPCLKIQGSIYCLWAYLEKVLKSFWGFDWNYFLKYLILPCFLSKQTNKQTNLKYYILLGLVGRHFTPYALVFQIFFIYLFFLNKWKLTNIENNTLINIRQHRQKAFATLSWSWLFRGWGRGGWVNPLKKNTCDENLFYR